MQPASAFLADLETLLRTLVAGAVAPAAASRPVKAASAKKSATQSVRAKPVRSRTRPSTGDRK